ncbi:MAG: hypothetical protein IJ752_08350 [Alphaproteobacteria bacterium]|nr:hypothetical protein [Alphaproteobacteria bacterium]
MVSQNEGLGAVVEKYLRRFYKDTAEAVGYANVYDAVIDEVERRLISVTLEVAQGNRLKTAKILGLNRNTLLKKMRRLNLDDKLIEKNKAEVSPLYRRRKRK